jgi:hypothetical protein
MRFILPILVCLGWLSANAQVSAITPSFNLAQTHIMQVTNTGQVQRTQVKQVVLSPDWDEDTLIRLLADRSLHAPEIRLVVQTRQKNRGSQRITFIPLYSNQPIFGRDAVMVIKNNKHIDSININLPKVKSAGAAIVDEPTARKAVSDMLLKHPESAQLSVSTKQNIGWIAMGQHLVPIAEYEVVDPVRLKHFTARVDLASGDFLGFQERTIN